MNQSLVTMTPADPSEEALFAAALGLAPSDRSAFLEHKCLGNPALRARMDALLEAHAALEGQETIPGNALRPAGEPADGGWDTDTLDAPVGWTIGRYKLLEKLGEGGCGVVYVAEQTEPVRRRVALKVIKLGMDTRQVVARFEAERQALAMMDHPNIAKVLDAGTTDPHPQPLSLHPMKGEGGQRPGEGSAPLPSGRPYFVMELVRGIRITDYCDQANLSTKDRLELFIKVCQAIQHAHQKGIIHRDIKPSNILVTLHDGVPVPKVIDFGIAKATEGKLTDATVYTQLHQFVGTPAYMSPEQAEMSGLDIDTRSDIYSLGVLLYELLAGSPPFDPKQLMSQGIDGMRKTIREQEPPRPSTRLATLGVDQLTTTAKRRSADTTKLLHQLQGDLDWIVMKCLEKDRQRRYETANGLAADIKRHLESEPVLARPPSSLYRFQKAFRRNKLLFAAGTAITVTLIFGLCATALAWRQTVAERDKALEARREAQASEERAIQAGNRAQAGEDEARRAAAVSRRTAYVADMALAQQAAAEGNLARARHLLDRYRPKAGVEDIRGFEWRYVWAQARRDETARLGQYGAFLGGIALSPDGRFLASVSPRGIEIRSLSNRALIVTLSDAGSGPLQFSPDGERLVTVRDSGLALWNTRTWQQETELAGAQTPFTFARRGEVIVARQGDHLAVYGTTLSKKVADLPGTVVFRSHQQCMTVSSDGDRVFIGYKDTIRGWDLQAGIELEPLSYPAGRLTVAVAVSPQGHLAAAHWNGQVTLWDLATRQRLHTFENHLAWVSAVEFSPDGAYLASASADQNILLFDTRVGKLVRRFRGHEGEIWALQYSSDGRWLVSGSRNDDSLRLWDATDVARDGDRYNVSRAETLSPFGFIDAGRSVLGQSSNGLFRIEVKTGVIRPIASGPPPWVAPPLKPGDAVQSVSADGNRIALGSSEGRRVEIWNLLSGKSERILTHSAGQFAEVALSPDGRHLAATGPGLQTRLYDTLDGSSELLGESGSGVQGRFAFSSNGSRLAQSEAAEGLVFDAASKKVVLRFPFHRPMSLALSPDGTLLAAGDSDNAIHLWDVDRGQKLGVLRGHVAGIWNLAFSPDGKTLASCADNRVKLWNLETQQEVLTLARFSAGAAIAEFVPDGSCLVSYSLDGRFHFWHAPSFKEIAAAEATEDAGARRP